MPKFANSADTDHLHPPLLDITQVANPFHDITTPLEDPYVQYDIQSPVLEPSPTADGVIETGIFDVPSPTANVCSTITTSNDPTYHELLPTQPSPFVDLLLDSMDYLYFSSCLAMAPLSNFTF
jgi:hypothetical protein